MRYSMGVELDFINASAKALGTEIRLGILEGLLQLGHQVTVLSTIPKKHLHILDGKGEKFDYSIFANLKYEPIKIPKMDLLLIESSVANVFFAQRNIERLIQIMLKYHGPICYYHHADQLSSFPLGAMMDGERSGFEKTKGISYKNIFKEVARDASIDRRFILMTHARPKLLKKKMDTNRFRYSRFDQSIRIPVGYSSTFDHPDKIIPISRRDYDLIYIGKEKSNVRTKRIINLYGEDYGCQRRLYGHWKTPPLCFSYGGYIPGHGKVYSDNMWGNSRASIVTADSWFTEIGMMTTRMIQSIRSHCLTLIDSNFFRPDEYIGSEYVVSNHEDVHKFLDMNSKQLGKEITEQQFRISTWKDILESAISKIKMGVS